ncbi:ABC transporter substrate-binding protein [Asanoa ishikariensis]|uniref:Iron complex transport system substrate-binding protein n=1 Tax=Asanoa ishikariensis TaxID=137265 RepID=A0A1H3UFK8_9ACTN|nr:iron-siderophore ABC transporter substrate-binding protein [Asanoa ishikariensis]GIF63789.1 ABC transporter substrate-binding protein [Asanoa ishikariensis]SDZ60449.1 iron complex transport system substrate-binding protein [Asanoa ishikariensis]
MRLGRHIAAVAGLLVLASGLSACADEKSPEAAASSSTAFPAVIEHKYGTTTVPAEPKRIVVVGLVEQDALLALGVTPIATTEWWGEHPGALWPWAKEKLGSNPVPQVLKPTDGIEIEKVLALNPDLVLGAYSGMTKEEYDKLSARVPTIAQPKGVIDFGTSWQDVTRIVGTAVGKKAEADKVVSDVEAKFAAAREANPAFAGKVAAVVTYYQGIYVYGSQDARGRFLKDLGFKLPDGLDALTGTEFGVTLSPEKTNLIDTDVLVWLIDDYAKDKASVQANPLYATLGVKTEARDVFLENNETLGAATSFVTALSLPYVLDNLVPQMAAAIDGNPATEVKRAA